MADVSYSATFCSISFLILVAGKSLPKKLFQESFVNAPHSSTGPVLLLIVITLTLQLLCIKELDFPLALAHIILWLFPYLSRKSRLSELYQPALSRRKWTDKLITTSYIYLIAGLCAFCLGDINVGTLCSITCIGSCLYHRNREVRFFNLDNIFATSLLAVFCYALMSAYYLCEVFFLTGVLGAPIAAFLLVYCGMPADVTIDNSGLCCTRKGRPIYDIIHTLWHIVSGLGPIVAVFYFYALRTKQFRFLLIPSSAELTTTQLAWAEVDPVWMPASALCVGVIINVAGNLAGIMPLD